MEKDLVYLQMVVDQAVLNLLKKNNQKFNQRNL